MNNYCILGFIVSCLIVSVCEAKRPKGDDASRITRTVTDDEGVSVGYQLYLPPDYDSKKQYPLVVCLHGSGNQKSAEYAASTAASSKLLEPDVRAKYSAFVMIPQTTTGWASGVGRDAEDRTNYRIEDQPEGAALILVLKALDDVADEYRVDRDRVYVTGQSMGGIATWDLIERHADRFAAAVPVCGIGDVTEAGKIRCPVWAFHGEKDPAIPVQCSRDMVEAMKKAGGAVKYTEFPDVGHGSWNPAWDDAELLPWLFAQRRGAK